MMPSPLLMSALIGRKPRVEFGAASSQTEPAHDPSWLQQRTAAECIISSEHREEKMSPMPWQASIVIAYG